MATSSKNVAAIAAIFIAVTVAAGYFSLASKRAPDSCRQLRETMLRHISGDESFSGTLVAVFPEDAVEAALEEKYAKLSVQNCSAQLAEDAKHKPAAPGDWVKGLKQADEEATDAVTECRNKRQSGELKNHVESTNCSNPAIIAAYQRIGYPHMELIRQFTDKRMEVGVKLDKGETTDEKSQIEFGRVAVNVGEAEWQYRTGAKK